MAAKITWNDGSLMLGPWELARVATRRWRVCAADGEWSELYDDAEDMARDAESEVRRLLKDAGVDVT